MALTITVCALTCAAVIACVLLKPQLCIRGFKFNTFWIPALIGGAVILIFRLPVSEWWHGVTAAGKVNPLKILTLFVCVTVLSLFLDEAGFFRYLAQVTLKRAKSAFRLFVLLYLVVSVLTVFTSNDVIILTFTPFICYFCARAGLRALPFLLTEFTAANTWSMALIIGNPTNMYLASDMDFAQYLSVMWLPALFSGLAAFAVLAVLFRKSLTAPMRPVEAPPVRPDAALCVIGLVHLGACTVMLAVSSYIGAEMWIITVIAAASLIVASCAAALVRRKAPRELLHAAARAPYALIPFVLSMFALVLALEKCGATAAIADILGKAPPVWAYGITSYLSANLFNNIPMSVLFADIISSAPSAAAVYAAVIGSNVGALLTPIGALAGIMWTGILGRNGVKFPLKYFLMYGAAVSVPVLLAALVGLAIIL